MTLFVVIAAAMAALALAWVLPALLRRRDESTPAQSGALNLAIIRDQLAELDGDVAGGTLSPQQYAQAREDLERRALDEAHVEGGIPAAQPLRARWTAAVLAIAIPLIAGTLYWQLGTPVALSPAATARAPDKITPQEIEAIVARLAARLEQTPDDGKGWAILARTYLVMQRYPESIAAYERAASLLKDDPDLLADYADALATAQGGRLEGKPLQLLTRALRIDPTQWKALALSGTAAFDRKEYRKAIEYWETLLARRDLDPELVRTVTSYVDEAKRQGGIAPPAAGKGNADVKSQPAAGTAKVEGTVALSAQLAGKAAPGDTVFVFARAAEGPRMPLAILRFQVKDLPAKFLLDDSLSMSPAMKMSGYPEVVIGARVSKSGNAVPQSGDLQGYSAKVKLGAAGVAVVIDQVVP
jgi:cytochrome c-type biogenesis protein CcmH